MSSTCESPYLQSIYLKKYISKYPSETLPSSQDKSMRVDVSVYNFNYILKIMFLFLVQKPFFSKYEIPIFIHEYYPVKSLMYILFVQTLYTTSEKALNPPYHLCSPQSNRYHMKSFRGDLKVNKNNFYLCYGVL